MSDEPRLEEKVIAQAIEVGLSSQVEAVDNISVDTHTDLLQAAQGELETTSIESKGLVLRDGLRLEALNVQIDQVAVHPLSLLLGQVKLKQPLDSTVQVLLTEADLNQAANSDTFINNLPSLNLETQEQPVTLKLQRPISMQLLENQIKISGRVFLHSAEYEDTFDMKAVLSLHPTHKLLLHEFCCESGKSLSIAVAIALLEWINKQVQSPVIEFAGSTCRITYLTLQQGQVKIEAETHIGVD